MVGETTGAVLTCYTAPGKIFSTREDLLAHYKTEWHEYNLKRKVAKLPPLPEDLFNKVKQQIEQRKALLQKSTEVKGSDHLKPSQKHVSKKSSLKRESPTVRKARLNAMNLKQALESEAEDDSIMSSSNPEHSEDENDDIDFDFDEDEAKKPVNLNQSLFELDECPLVFESVDQNLDFMQKTYGFFVPDREYLVDIKGLITYCSQKIRVGKFCLFCDRRFNTTNAVVQHMVSKQHCKIKTLEPAVDEDEDQFDEFEDFYDYSKQADGKTPNSDLVIEALDTGELKFKDADGAVRIIGNKNLRRYYKQKIRDFKEIVVSTPSGKANTDEMNERMKKLLVIKDGDETPTYTLAKVFTKIEKRIHQDNKKRDQIKQRLSLKDGLQNNLQVKNRTAKKNVGQGLGVHG